MHTHTYTQLRIDSPTACRLDVVANIEPKVPLPQPIINFGTRKLAGMLLFYLQKHVRAYTWMCVFGWDWGSVGDASNNP